MKNKSIVLFLPIILFSCNINKHSESNTSDPITTEQKDHELSTKYLGNYHGIQPSYFIKNKFGDEMVVNGKKISVPAIEFKFIIEEKNVVSLQQVNLEDNSRVYYDGTYKIISEHLNVTRIECNLSDGQGSNPIYILTINEIDRNGICAGKNEPEFSIKKT